MDWALISLGLAVRSGGTKQRGCTGWSASDGGRCHCAGRTSVKSRETDRENGYKKKRKKGEKRNLEWQTGCSPRPPTLTQRYVVLRAGWSSGGSYKFQVSSKSVERFSRCGGRNLPFPILKASGLYNSLQAVVIIHVFISLSSLTI